MLNLSKLRMVNKILKYFTFNLSKKTIENVQEQVVFFFLFQVKIHKGTVFETMNNYKLQTSNQL